MKKIKTFTKELLNRLPYIHGIAMELKDFKEKSWRPPGHFYSPVISLEEILIRKNQIYKEAPTLPYGIDLNRENQVKLLKIIVQYYFSIPFSSKGNTSYRYYFDNKYYAYADGVFLYLLINYFKPSQIIEVGSGFSSALMLDVNHSIFDNKISLTFIEPFPEMRLNNLVRKEDKYQLIKGFLQDVDLNYFKRLKKNDMLFIDSSHVVKTGSELNYLMFEILPVLQSGVIVHFHDIFYPFEYPIEWIKEKRSWNEIYFIRAFLMHNPDFEILLFSSFVQMVEKDWLIHNLPLAMKDQGSSLFLVKK